MNKHHHRFLRPAVLAACLLLAIATICALDFMPLSKGTEWVGRFLVDRDLSFHADGSIKADIVQPFSFQYAMWVCFYVGIGELLVRLFLTREQEQELSMGFLPTDPQTLITMETMPDIHQRLTAANRNGYPTRIIRLLGYQFQSSQSVSLCNELLNTQTELYQHEISLNYGVVRYIAWLLPSIGFMGTVWGILKALESATAHIDQPEQLLGFVIGDMSVAFWTTLLALIQAALLLFVSHLVEGREERMLNTTAQYCVTNFINRLWVH